MGWWIRDILDFFEEVLLPLAVIFTILAAVLGVLIVGCLYGFERPSCYAQWRDSGLQVRWSVFGDCQLSADGKRWVTDDAYVTITKRVQVQK